MARGKKRGRNINGLILLDKPKGETSNSSLQRVKSLLKASKAGHTGSLDPLATGVLPLCFGEATKISQFLLDSDKVYRTRIRFGMKTDTGDSEGSVLQTVPDVALTNAQVEDVLERFRGEIEQLPSMFSALKHHGVPLYKLAREGKTVEREKRRVMIHELKLLALEKDEAEILIHCSKGTYIRTLADDLGEALQVGGHVIALRRLQAGPFTEDQCVSMEQLEAVLETGGLTAADQYLLATDNAVQMFPRVELPAATAIFVKQGQPVIARHLPTEGMVRLYEENRFIGVGEILEDGRVAPRRLLKAS